MEKETLHVRYSQRIQQADVDQENTHQWLHSMDLKDLSLLYLTQELPSKNNKKWVDHKCRMCDQYDETVDHLVSRYPVICPTE